MKELSELKAERDFEKEIEQRTTRLCEELQSSKEVSVLTCSKLLLLCRGRQTSKISSEVVERRSCLLRVAERGEKREREEGKGKVVLVVGRLQRCIAYEYS